MSAVHPTAIVMDVICFQLPSIIFLAIPFQGLPGRDGREAPPPASTQINIALSEGGHTDELCARDLQDDVPEAEPDHREECSECAD